MTREDMLDAYDADHRHPVNRALHVFGITSIAASCVLVFVDLRYGLLLAGTGWLAQFVGHAIEGKPPSFARDKRFMAVGAWWYLRVVSAPFRKKGSVRTLPGSAPEGTLRPDVDLALRSAHPIHATAHIGRAPHPSGREHRRP